MARIQYQGAARAGGYRPQQIDERNVARIRDETARQVDGMRQVAEAEINSRREVAKAMKENAAYTERAEERNFQIQTANSNRVIQGLQAQAQRDLQQFNINSKTNEGIFESLATLSTSAGAIVKNIQESREKANLEKQILDAQSSETDADKEVLRQADQWKLSATAASITGAVNESIANGGSEYVGEKIKAQNQAVATDYNAGQIYKTLTTTYPVGLQRRIAAIEKGIQRRLSAEELIQEIGSYKKGLFDTFRIDRFKFEFLKPALDSATNFERSLIATRQQEDIEVSKNNRREKAGGNVLMSSPQDFQRVATNSYIEVLDTFNGDRTATWDWFEKNIFNQIDEKGSYVLSTEQIAQIPIFTEKGQAPERFGTKFAKTRYANILNERVRIDTQKRKQQLDLDQLNAAEMEDKLFRGLGSNPTEKQVRDAQRLFTATTGRESTKLNTAEKTLTIEAKSKQRIINAVTELRDFELTPEIVAAAKAADPTKGRIIEERYNAYNSDWKSESYKAASKSLESLVSGTTGFGTTKTAKAGALPMIAYLQTELRNRTALYKPTLGITAAANKAAQELEAEYNQGYQNKNSKFYRQVNRDGSVSYPKLEPPRASAAERQRRVIEEMRKTVKKIGIEETVKTSIPLERLEYIKNNFSKPTFKPTPQEVALVGMSNGMPLFELYNLAFKGRNQNFRLSSPLKLNGQDLKFDEQDLKILSDPNKGPAAKNAVIQRLLNPNAFRDGTTMRPGSPLQRTIVTQARDDTARSLGSDFVIEGGRRGAKYLFPADAVVLKVVTGKNTEYRREAGDQRRGYGNNVEVRMQTPYGPADFLFAHFDKVGDLKPGQTVKAGTFMGTQGRTGSTTGAHVSVDAFYPNSFNPNRQAREWFLKTFLQQ
jgi:hypothetical protein